jgi:hypothetical protein
MEEEEPKSNQEEFEEEGEDKSDDVEKSQSLSEGPSPAKKRKMQAGPGRPKAKDSCVEGHFTNGTMTFKGTEGTPAYICVHCHQALVNRGDGNTSGRIRHLEKCRKFEGRRTFSEERRDSMSTTTDGGEGVLEEWLAEQKSEVAARAIAVYVAADDETFSVSEKPGFLWMMHAVAPHFVVPGRTAVTCAFEKLYCCGKKLLRSRLKVVPVVALTMDGWTSKAHKKYVTVTTHFVENASLKSFVLATRRLFFARDAACIRDLLTSVVTEWELRGKISAVVSDNEATTLSAIESALPSIGGKYLVRCADHTLQLAARAALSRVDVEKKIERWRAVAMCFTSSSKWGDLLEEEALAQKCGVRRAKLDVETRWNSTWKMLERLKLLKGPIRILMAREDWGSARLSAVPGVEEHQGQASNGTSRDRPDPNRLVLDDGDFQMMNDILEVLKPLMEATVTLEGDSYATLSLVYLVFGSLKRVALAPKATDNSFVKDLKALVVRHLMHHWTEKLDGDVCLMATFLDPRFRTLPFLDEKENADMREKFIECALRTIETIADTGAGGALAVGRTWSGEVEATPSAPGSEPVRLGLAALDGHETPIEDPVNALGVGPLLAVQSQTAIPIPSNDIGTGSGSASVLPAAAGESDSALGLTAFERIIDSVMAATGIRGRHRRPEGENGEGSNAVSAKELLTLELRGYFMEPAVALKTNPIRWWWAYRAKYSLMWLLAERFLICPASSSPSERVFSDAGNVVDDNSCSLSDDHVDQKVFLYHNWKQKLFPDQDSVVRQREPVKGAGTVRSCDKLK